ncbi:hypothetical protein [Microbispora sp. CA-102843]
MRFTARASTGLDGETLDDARLVQLPRAAAGTAPGYRPVDRGASR